jgi:hypothetical protein
MLGAFLLQRPFQDDLGQLGQHAALADQLQALRADPVHQRVQQVSGQDLARTQRKTGGARGLWITGLF